MCSMNCTYSSPDGSDGCLINWLAKITLEFCQLNCATHLIKCTCISLCKCVNITVFCLNMRREYVFRGRKQNKQSSKKFSRQHFHAACPIECQDLHFAGKEGRADKFTQTLVIQK